MRFALELKPGRISVRAFLFPDTRAADILTQAYPLCADDEPRRREVSGMIPAECLHAIRALASKVAIGPVCPTAVCGASHNRAPTVREGFRSSARKPLPYGRGSVRSSRGRRLHNRSRGRRLHKAAFTLIELLVVVAIIALLISILLPSLDAARQAGKRAKCLANLSAIGKGMQSYAAEDKKELLIPIHARQALQDERDSDYYYRTIEWFAFGGRSAPEAFIAPRRLQIPPAPGGAERRIDDSSDYGAKTRPLNRYLYRDIYGSTNAEVSDDSQTRGENLDLFRCPSDNGYPDSVKIDDSPLGNAERPCYDTIGNSYRASLAGFHTNETWFSLGMSGHKLSSFQQASRQVVAGEPTWFNMIRWDDINQGGDRIDDAIVLTGWHRRLMLDNVLYGDGSARETNAAGLLSPDATTALAMGMEENNAKLLSRGPRWQIDNWPVPGVKIRGGFPGRNESVTVGAIGAISTRFWPFAGAKDIRRQ